MIFDSPLTWREWNPPPPPPLEGEFNRNSPLKWGGREYGDSPQNWGKQGCFVPPPGGGGCQPCLEGANQGWRSRYRIVTLRWVRNAADWSQFDCVPTSWELSSRGWKVWAFSFSTPVANWKRITPPPRVGPYSKDRPGGIILFQFCYGPEYRYVKWDFSTFKGFGSKNED